MSQRILCALSNSPSKNIVHMIVSTPRVMPNEKTFIAALRFNYFIPLI